MENGVFSLYYHLSSLYVVLALSTEKPYIRKELKKIAFLILCGVYFLALFSWKSDKGGMSAVLLGNIACCDKYHRIWTVRTVNKLERHGGKLWLWSSLRTMTLGTGHVPGGDMEAS